MLMRDAVCAVAYLFSILTSLSSVAVKASIISASAVIKKICYFIKIAINPCGRFTAPANLS
ncbi:hypothetical protein [Candidatus Marithrix sp. Canyon 246]|uniref:hypothetical protein n=1 Tax=Candidatus Marithrix sp. Canyon 246 TaxID=1827136 RepID=UPI00084A06F9|nr:hypothetical protein [Candidatus Marithrix sp. Canyon 246]